MKYVLLKDVCSINMGQSPDSNSYNDNGDGVPFFQGNADFGERYPVTRKWCTEPTKIAEAEDILISVRAPIGAMNYAKEQCCIGRGLAALTPDKARVSPEYIFWLLKAKNGELNNKGTGSTFKAISRKVLEETQVPDVGLPEQISQSAILEKVYAVIQDRKQELQKLDELIKARFIELFGNLEFNTKNWNVKTLGEVCKVGSSKRIYQNEQSLSGVPFLRISDLVNRMDTGSESCDLYIPEEKFNELKANNLVPKCGDILLTARGTLGRCYIVKDNDKFYFQDGMITWLSNYDKSIIPLFISYMFDNTSFRKQIDCMQAGSTVAYLSIAMAKKLNVIIPPIELQNQFAEFVQQVDKSKVVV